MIISFSRSSYYTDKQYLMLRLGLFTMDIALMTFGPAYQISLNSISLTDKLHTSSSGQYLDLIHTPVRSKEDVLVVLFRRVSWEVFTLFNYEKSLPCDKKLEEQIINF